MGRQVFGRLEAVSSKGIVYSRQFQWRVYGKWSVLMYIIQGHVVGWGGGGGVRPPLFGQQLSLGPFFNVDKKLCCIFGAFTV